MFHDLVPKRETRQIVAIGNQVSAIGQELNRDRSKLRNRTSLVPSHIRTASVIVSDPTPTRKEKKPGIIEPGG
ncbi:MAG: hypothetical protein ACP5D7_13180 [Limnospira sp.]